MTGICDCLARLTIAPAEALGDRGLGLLLLLGRILVGVRVEDLAVRAELAYLALEVRAVLRLVPCGLRLRQQQRD
jgi:hypothetical protein